MFDKKHEHQNELAEEFLDSESLTKLNRLAIEVHRAIEGIFAGRHKSPLFGASVEFADHKLYTYGDDIRKIDWNAYARSDRYLLKRFEAETNLSAVIVLDATASMGVGDTPEMTKFRFGAILAASLSYILLKQHDTVGLVVVNDEMEYSIFREGLSSLSGVLYQLARVQTKGSKSLVEAVELVRARMKKRGLVIVISDLLEDTESLIPRLALMAEKEHTLSLFHVLSREEIEFPFEDITRFKDAETPLAPILNPKELSEAYREEIKNFIGSTRRRITSAGGEYTLSATHLSADKVLLTYLRYRNKKSTRRVEGSMMNVR